jgi:hypothetical protein
MYTEWGIVDWILLFLIVLMAGIIIMMSISLNSIPKVLEPLQPRGPETFNEPWKSGDQIVTTSLPTPSNTVPAHQPDKTCYKLTNGSSL